MAPCKINHLHPRYENLHDHGDIHARAASFPFLALIPLPPADERVSAADFEAERVEQVANGWDGRPVPGVSDARLARINR